MLRCTSIALAPVVLLLANGRPTAAGGDPGLLRWEYRVLAKEQVLELGKKDLTAGLNHLGMQGWELAGIDNGYIFKRRQTLGPNIVAELKQRLAAAEAEVDSRKARLLWTERMARKGFVSESRVEAERSLVTEAEMDADRLRRDLDAQALPLPKQTPPTK